MTYAGSPKRYKAKQGDSHSVEITIHNLPSCVTSGVLGLHVSLLDGLGLQVLLIFSDLLIRFLLAVLQLLSIHLLSC